MKYAFSILLITLVSLFSCKPKATVDESGDLADTTWLHDPEPDRWANPTETFSGTAGDYRVRFQHKDFTSYRLITGIDTTEGTLNTERGFLTDEDATLYILYYEFPDSVLWHFARMSDGMILMLDKDMNVLPGTEFKKE